MEKMLSTLVLLLLVRSYVTLADRHEEQGKGKICINIVTGFVYSNCRLIKITDMCAMLITLFNNEHLPYSLLNIF